MYIVICYVIVYLQWFAVSIRIILISSCSALRYVAEVGTIKIID